MSSKDYSKEGYVLLSLLFNVFFAAAPHVVLVFFFVRVTVH